MKDQHLDTDMSNRIQSLKREADVLESLREEFPDLHEYKTRWRTVLVSKRVNENPEAVHTCHSCGCCLDAWLDAWFHVKRGEKLIYTDPPILGIGTGNDAYGLGDNEPRDNWLPDWKEKVKRHCGVKGIDLLEPIAPKEIL